MTEYWCFVIGLVIGIAAGCVVALAVNASWSRRCIREIKWWSRYADRLINRIEQLERGGDDEL